MELVTLLNEIGVLTESISLYVVEPLTIMFLGLVIGRISGNATRKLGTTTELDKHTRLFLGQRLPTTEIIAAIISGAIYTIAIIWALSVANIFRLVLEGLLIFFGSLAAVGLILGVAEFIPDLLAFFRINKKYSIGDTISQPTISGTITHIGRSMTIIDTGDDLIALPNRSL